MNTKYFFILLLILAGSGVNAQEADSLDVTYQMPLFDFDYAKPVFVLEGHDKTNPNRALRFYAFSGYREGIEPVKRAFNFNMDTRLDEQAGTINQRMYNLSIEEMVTFGMKRRSEVILEVRDPSRYRYLPAYGPKLEWMRKNAYCYELTVPRSNFTDLRQVEDDIDRFFKIRRSREKRNVRVLVLSTIVPETESYPVPKGPGVVTINGLEELLQGWGLPKLVVSLKRNDLLIDLGAHSEPSKAMSLADLQRVLQQQGFRLKEEMRLLEFLVIRELK